MFGEATMTRCAAALAAMLALAHCGHGDDEPGPVRAGFLAAVDNNATADLMLHNGTDATAEVPLAAPCLCAFDVDRTLTGKQGLRAPTCPGNSVVPGVGDPAYGGGVLTLSEVGQAVQRTFCGGCYVATVSHGDAGGPVEQAVLLQHLRGVETPPNVWSYGCRVRSPLVLGCAEGQKQLAVRAIIDWYRTNRRVSIADADVYMFDDREDNVSPFRLTRFNARQISCPTRDGPVGLCGAALWEIQRTPGVHTCNR